MRSIYCNKLRLKRGAQTETPQKLSLGWCQSEEVCAVHSPFTFFFLNLQFYNKVNHFNWICFASSGYKDSRNSWGPGPDACYDHTVYQSAR